MRRSEFTKLTGLKAAVLNNLSRRDQFPFLRGDLPQGRGWGSYSAQTLLKTKLAFALAGAGATQHDAGHFVEREYDLLFSDNQFRAAEGAQPVFFGYFDTTREEFDLEHERAVRSSARVPVCGTWTEIGEIVAAHASRHHAAIGAVVVVNVSAELGFLRESAVASGVGATVLSDDQLVPEAPQ